MSRHMNPLLKIGQPAQDRGLEGSSAEGTGLPNSDLLSQKHMPMMPERGYRI